MRIEINPEATDEAHQAYLWYRERSPGAAIAFQAELHHALQRIADHPEAWSPLNLPVRRYLMHRFPYKIVYEATEDVVTILAVAHTSRRPGYWKKRRK